MTEDATRLYDYLHPDEHRAFQDSIHKSAETMTSWDHGFRVNTPGKGTIWLSGKSNPRRLSNGSVLWNGVLTDVTERKQAEEKLRGSETILIVDDDDIQRRVSTELLERLGYEVSSVECGEKAVDLLRDNPHDLVILDMVMPGGIDGAETYERVIEISPDQKAIIISGFSESARVKIAQELGAGAFVKKPLTKKAIANAVRTELDRKEKVGIT